MATKNPWDEQPASDGASAQRVVDDTRHQSLADRGLPVFQALPASAHPATFHFAAAGRLRASFTGWFGDVMDEAVRQGLLGQDVESLVAPFIERQDDGGGFRGEFWGKWALAAIDVLRHRNDPALAEVLDRSVRDVMATVEPDGYLSTYGPSHRLEVFDLWVIKYTVWALLEYADYRGEPQAAAVAERAIGSLADELAAQRTRVPATGLDVLGGVGSSSLLAVLGLYSEGRPAFEALADQVIEDWAEDGPAGRAPARLLERLKAGCAPADLPSGKAYELMSCVEGLAALARVRKDRGLAQVVVSAVEAIADQEITIIGSGSSQELWARTALSQTRPLPQPLETCVTMSWLRLCREALHLTGQARFAEAMELTLHNALLGAMSPGGGWWSYFTPLEGSAEPSPRQFPEIDASCCVMNGLRGLVMTLDWAVESVDGGLRLNTYLDGRYDWSGGALEVSGDTWRSGRAVVTVQSDGRWTLRLRVPSWSQAPSVRVNGDEIASVVPGEWAVVEREWRRGDVVTADFGIAVRFVTAPGEPRAVAALRGSVVLARKADEAARGAGFAWLTGRVLDAEDVPAGAERLEVRAQVEYRPTHYFDWGDDEWRLVDFASAASASQEQGGDYRVWFAQPFLDGSR